MNSMTETQTISPVYQARVQNDLCLELRLLSGSIVNELPQEAQELCPEQKLRELLAKIKTAINKLPIEHQEEVSQTILKWELSFFSTYHINSESDYEKMRAAHALLFLSLSHIEYNIFEYASDDREKVEWIKFSNEIKQIVKFLLPIDSDFEAFIEAHIVKQLEVESRLDTAQEIKEIMHEIFEGFKRLENVSYDSIDRINENLQREFEHVKTKLTELNIARTAAIEELHSEFDRLTEQVTGIYQRLEEQLNRAQNIGQRIELKERDLMQILNDSEIAVNRI